MARSHISIWALVYAWECVLVCVCIWYLCRYITGKKKSLFNSVFFYLAWKSLEKKSKNSTHYYEVPTRVYTKSLHYHWCCSSLYYVTFSYLIFFIRFSPLDKIDLNVMLSYMLLFTCSFFYSSNRYTYLLCYIFFAH